MKKILVFLCLSAVLLSLAFPESTALGVKNGINISLYSAIPSLMVFILIINFMLKNNLCNYLSFFMYPLFSRLFNVSKNGCFAVICGFFCGYPLGIKTIFELNKNKMISDNEAKFLITFCNNTSISFVINYIGALCLSSSINTGLLLFFIYSPSIIVGIINSRIYRQKFKNADYASTSNGTNPIKSTIMTLANLSVYIIIFSVVSCWMVNLFKLNDVFSAYVTCFLEITAGIKAISLLDINDNIKLFSICLLTIFGGVSITAQSLSFINHKKYYKYYLLGKLEALVIFTVEYILSIII